MTTDVIESEEQVFIVQGENQGDALSDPERDSLESLDELVDDDEMEPTEEAFLRGYREEADHSRERGMQGN